MTDEDGNMGTSGSLTASGTVDTAVNPSGSLSAAMTLATRWPAGVRA